MKLKNKYGNIIKETDNKHKIDYLMSIGYTEVEDEEIPIDKMTVPQLEAYAEKNNIDLSGCNNKTEKLERIKEFTEKE